MFSYGCGGEETPLGACSFDLYGKRVGLFSHFPGVAGTVWIVTHCCGLEVRRPGPLGLVRLRRFRPRRLPQTDPA